MVNHTPRAPRVPPSGLHIECEGVLALSAPCVMGMGWGLPVCIVRDGVDARMSVQPGKVFFFSLRSRIGDRQTPEGLDHLKGSWYSVCVGRCGRELTIDALQMSSLEKYLDFLTFLLPQSPCSRSLFP